MTTPTTLTKFQVAFTGEDLHVVRRIETENFDFKSTVTSLRQFCANFGVRMRSIQNQKLLFQLANYPLMARWDFSFQIS